MNVFFTIVERATPLFFISSLVLVSLLSFLFTAFVFQMQKRKKAKIEREKNRLRKEAMYTLPNPQNSFLEERLHRLTPQKEEVVKAEDCDLSLAYVRELMGKLKRKDLSVSDRLHVENFSRDLTQFAFQREYKSSELGCLNDRFLELIKLASKYSV